MTTLHDIRRLLRDQTPLRAAIAAVVVWPADTGRRRWRKRRRGPERWQAMREWRRLLRDFGGEG